MMVSYSKQNVEQVSSGSSKQRREQIKSGIDMLKKVLPLTRQDIENLSQLQTLHAACTYIRKVIAFQGLQVNIQNDIYINAGLQQMFGSQLGLSETMFGFVIALTKDRHLIYVSDNVVDYLGLKSTEVLLSCETFEDVLHPIDEDSIIDMFNNGCGNHEFYCSWNASKIKRRVHAKADAKIIKINGRFIANGNLFVATCVPMLKSMNRDYLVATSPTCFTTVHSLDLKTLEICEKGQNLLKYRDSQCTNTSLYELIHANDLDLIKKRHKNLLNTKSQKGKVDTVQILRRDGTFIHCLVNMYYCVNSYIICKYQVLSEVESIEYGIYMDRLNQYISKALPQTDGAHGIDDIDQDLSSGPSSNMTESDEEDYELTQTVLPIKNRKRSYKEVSDRDESSVESFQYNDLKKIKRESTDSMSSNVISFYDQSIVKQDFDSFGADFKSFGFNFPVAATSPESFSQDQYCVQPTMYPQVYPVMQQLFDSCANAYYNNNQDLSSPVSTLSNSSFDNLDWDRFIPSPDFISYMNNEADLNDINEIIQKGIC